METINMETINNIWKDRYTYAQYISIAATLLNGLGLLVFKPSEADSILSVIGALALFFGLGLTLCSYCLGGLWTAVKAALHIAKWGWLVVPFPYDLATGPVAFVLSMIVLFLFPVIPVRKALKEHKVQQYVEQQIR